MMRSFGIIIVLWSLIFVFCESTPCIGRRQRHVGFLIQRGVFITAGILIKRDLLYIPAAPYLQKAGSKETIWVVAGTCTSKEPYDKSYQKLKVANVYYDKKYTHKAIAYNIRFVKTQGAFSDSKYISPYVMSKFDQEEKEAQLMRLQRNGVTLHMIGFCKITGRQIVVEALYVKYDGNHIFKSVPFIGDEGCKLQPGSILVLPGVKSLIALVVDTYAGKDTEYRVVPWNYKSGR